LKTSAKCPPNESRAEGAYTFLSLFSKEIKEVKDERTRESRASPGVWAVHSPSVGYTAVRQSHQNGRAPHNELQVSLEGERSRAPLILGRGILPTV